MEGIVNTNCSNGSSEILIDKLEEFLSPIGYLANNINKAILKPVQITDKYYNKFSSDYIGDKFLDMLDRINDG